MRFEDIDMAIQKICSRFNRISGIILGLLVALLVFNIVGRFIKYPITGSYEAVQYGFSLVVCLAVAFTAVEEGHIFIDLIFKRYPQKIQFVLEIISKLLSIFVFSLITWRLCASGVEAYILNERSSTLDLPVFLFHFALAIGFALLCVVVLFKLWKWVKIQK